jgi:uncharacterized protein YkwD
MKKFYSKLSLGIVSLCLLSNLNLFNKPKNSSKPSNANANHKIIKSLEFFKCKLDSLDNKKNYDFASIRKKVFEEFKKIRKDANLNINFSLDDKFSYFAQLFADTLVYSKNDFSHFFGSDSLVILRFWFLHRDKKILQEACARKISEVQKNNFNFNFLEQTYCELLGALLNSKSHKEILLTKNIDVCGIGLGFKADSTLDIVYTKAVLVLIIGKDKF